MRSQPYGISVWRGSGQRAYGSRAWRRPLAAVSAAAALVVVGTGRASIPASLSTATGTTVRIPVPAGTAAGDWLVVGLYQGRYGTGWASVPSGWNTVLQTGGPGPPNAQLGIFERQADGTEPAFYDWFGLAGYSRGGTVISVRNVASLGPSGSAASFTVPSLDADAGDMLVAFGSCIVSSVSEQWGATAPLVLQQQHVTNHDGIPYGNRAGGALGIEEDLTGGATAGRTFTNAIGSNPSAGGIILKL